ncbi:tyrosine-protein phosphatase [Streptomyces sp. NPDC093085]|uniref:tyrosine-protein phosphatase n=1 Tax=Streptomyces sp. NPDC093085 TaxID=3155068 RepID=UPI003442A4C2
MTQQSPQVPATEPELSGVRNFRDVGGLPTVDGGRIRYGALYRSGHLARATADDSAFLSGLGLHTVFDFRNSADIKLDGEDVELAGVRNVNIPLSDPAEGAEFWHMVRNGDLATLRSLLSDGAAAARMTASYRTIVTGRTAEHGRLLHALAEDSVPALLHCAAGKDRAGISVAVVLLAVGAERDAIEADYLKSNDPHRRYTFHRGDGVADEVPAEAAELLGPLFDARAGYLAAAFETIERNWGSADRYLSEGLGLAPATRERLRARLVDTGTA